MELKLAEKRKGKVEWRDVGYWLGKELEAEAGKELPREEEERVNWGGRNEGRRRRPADFKEKSKREGAGNLNKRTRGNRNDPECC